MPLPEIVITGVLCLLTGVVAGVLWSRRAFARDRAALRQELDKALLEARTDPLTGVGNRKALDEELARQTALARRYTAPCSLILVDFDRLKAVNDREGHAAGDRVLVRLAHFLSRIARESDRVLRSGGDEFLIILPQTDLAGGIAFAQRILDQIAGGRAAPGAPSTSQFPAEVQDLAVSVGVTALRTGDTAEGLMRRVDRALYRAKRAGGMQLSVAEHPSPGESDGRAETP
jgi:diguanylate cyclase